MQRERQAKRMLASLIGVVVGTLALVAVLLTLFAPAVGGGERSASARRRPTPSATASPTKMPTPTAAATPDPQTDGYVTRTYHADNGATMTYYLYVPAGAPGQHYPVVLLLHGGGEVAKTTNTPAKNQQVLLSQQYVQVWTSSAVQTRWPSFVVVPQVVAPNRWVSVPAKQGSYALQSAPASSLAMAKAIVDQLLSTYSDSDPARIYVTGISMGGYGVWDAIERWPGYFTAAMPVAGAGDPARAATLVHLPIWDFHGSADTNVPVSGSRDMYAALRAAGGASCYTEYAGATHGIWMTVYGNMNLLGWLFAQGTPAANSSGMPRCAV